MRWRLSYDGTLAALDSQLESGSPGEVTTGDVRGSLEEQGHARQC